MISNDIEQLFYLNDIKSSFGFYNRMLFWQTIHQNLIHKDIFKRFQLIGDIIVCNNQDQFLINRHSIDWTFLHQMHFCPANTRFLNIFLLSTSCFYKNEYLKHRGCQKMILHLLLQINFVLSMTRAIENNLFYCFNCKKLNKT